MRKVLLTDGMQEVLEDLVFALGDSFAIRTCSNGLRLRELMEDFKPDILLLDLSMPGYDPTAFLRELSGEKPLILATGFFQNDYLVRLLEGWDVKGLMIKPLVADGVASRLLKLELELDSEPELRGAVHEVMLGTGVRLRYSGFRQLTEGILFACKNDRYALIEELYPHVAVVCASTAQAVEKAITRCIRQAFERANKEVWAALFGQKRCPSNGVFIRRLSQGVTKKQGKP